ncbi:MAG: cysteine desulfurase [Clostridia bacterium]|nr:cysteine desulfurase [Clostridia bacterium]
MNECIYLDHAATTFPEEAVIGAMAQCMRETPFNASGAYSAAGDARRIHRLCRRQLAGMLSCDIAEIVFTSGGTEANNQVLRSFAGAHVVLSAIEHHSVLEAAKAAGCSITLVSPDASGFVSPESISRALRPETRLICLMAANNETGVIQPVAEVYEIARSRRIHLHVDAVQAFGHIPMSSRICDSMAVSAHKLYGPRGAGALFVRAGAKIAPLLLGGGQEGGLRAGTENTPAICGFHTAAQMADADMQLRTEQERALLDAFVLRMQKSGLILLGQERNRLPGVLALRLPGMSAEQMIAALDLRGILISGGAACAVHSGKPSHVYTAMGLSDEEAAQVVRISIGRHTTAGQLDKAASAMESIILQPAHQNTSR